MHYKEKINALRLKFPNEEAAKRLNNKFNYKNGYTLNSVGHFMPGEIKVHEHNIDPIIKFTAKRKILLSSWITAIEINEEINEINEDSEIYNSGKNLVQQILI